MSLVSQYMRIRDPRRDGAEGTKTTQRSNPPHGGPMSIGVVLVTTGWQELDLIETLGQRRCSEPVSGNKFPESVEESGSISDDWTYPVHTGLVAGAIGDDRLPRACRLHPTVSLHAAPFWRVVRCHARYGFAV